MPLPPPGWMPDPSRLDLERYWDGKRWTSRTRDAVSKLERIPMPAARPRRKRRHGAWIFVAGLVAASVAVTGYVGKLPAWAGWPEDWTRGMPEGPSVAYPVFGTSELSLYLARSMIAQEESIDVSFVTTGARADQLEDAVNEALTQNPYVFASSWTVISGTGITTIEPDYTYSNEEAERRRVATRDAVATLVANSGAASAASDAEGVKMLHDAIAGVARYDWDAYESIGTGTATPAVEASQEAYGILVNGTAVCTGYAETMLLAAHAVGIPAVVVTGEVNDGITTGGHAWNRVRVDGAWRVVDVTWDDATAQDGTEALHHDYLLLPLGDPALSTRSTDGAWVVDGNEALFQ